MARPTLRWRVLSPNLHVGQDGDRIAAVVYTVEARDDGGREWLEFCCVLTGPPVHQEVLFGVAERVGESWDNRWDRGRGAAEFVYFDARGEWWPAE